MRRRALGSLVVVALTAACSTAPDAPSRTDRAPTDVPDTDVPDTHAPDTHAPNTHQARLDEDLRDVAWADDVPAARSLIRRGADVNAQDETQQSAYLIATSEGHLELLELTLAHGAKVDDTDGWHGTGLIRAAERGHHDVVGRLLQAGVPRDHVNRIGYQAVHEAVWFGEDTPDDLATVRVLVAGGVELDRPSTTEGLTPLQMARQRGHTRLEAALAHAVSAQRPTDPDAALLAAASTGDADDAATALRSGADLRAVDDRGRTPLRLAADGDHQAVHDLLVDLGADRPAAGQSSTSGTKR